MHDKKHKLLELKTNSIVDSLFVGNYKTKFKGRGIEFATYKEYDFYDNVKNIDFVKSDVEGKTLVKLYDEERELNVYFIIDLNESFYNSGLNSEKIDIVYAILYLIGFSALKNGDKVGALVYDNNNSNISIAKKGKHNFVNIVKFVDKIIDNNSLKLNFYDKFNIKNQDKEIKKDGLSYFNSLRIKNSLVLYITDKLDINKTDLKILGVKNDLILCNVFNSFENNLIGDGVIGLNKGLQNIFLDLDNEVKIKKYRELRLMKINELKSFVLKNGGRYILLDETKNLYKEFYKIF